MARIFIGFMICFLFLNCSKKDSLEENIPYIISQKNSSTKSLSSSKDKNIPPLPPPPPNPAIPGWLVYGTDTFIINSDSTAYYFQNKAVGFICGTPNADTIPYFSDLHPRNLIVLSNKNIYDFIKLNYSDDFRNATFIASQSDTLNSKMFFDLTRSLNFFTRDRDFVVIRRTTQEEDTVIYYKKINKYYNSENIKWDKSRIKFPEHVKFIKRKE